MVVNERWASEWNVKKEQKKNGCIKIVQFSKINNVLNQKYCRQFSFNPNIVFYSM